MEGLSWEERYLRLRDEHTTLTQKSNEQDDTIRRMNTKLSQIEKSLKVKYRLEHDGIHGNHSGAGNSIARAPAAGGVGSVGAGGDASGFGYPRNRENERLVEELQRYNGVLQRENTELKTKVKTLTEALAKRKKELVAARLARTRATGARVTGPRSPCPAARSVGMRSRHVQLGKKRSADDMDVGAPGATENTSTRKLSELVDKLRVRVSNAEEQLKAVRAENQRLHQEKIDAGCAPEDAHEQAMVAASAARRERSVGREREEVETLHRELKEAQAKAQLIQARFDHLESRTLAQTDLHEGSVDKLQEANRQLRDIRRELQDVLHERDVAVARGAKVEDLEETISELRRHNKELEDQVTRLCESPFISQAFRNQERAERVLELEQGGRAAQLKIDHLQEAAQTHHAALVSLQKQTMKLREQKERAESALQEMRVKHNETEVGAQLMADKMRLYAGDEDVDLEELERALTIVRRKMDNPEACLGFLDNPEGENMDNVPALRRKLQRVQVSNLNLTRELERAERMLKAQMSINRDLHVELEEACRRSTLDRGELGQKLRDYEALALERLTTVHRLEAQVKQLLYGPARRQRLGATADTSAAAAAMEQAQESALLSELAEGDFAADQNIVEVWVVGAELEPGVLSAGSSSFVVVDFFDFESQATPLLPGESPAFDFATTFKVTVDDFFLRYLGTEGLVLELNQARAADFELLARRQVPLAGLLSSRPRIVLQREPMISTRDGAVVGYVHLEVRMALPVTELYALFLERRPEEKERVQQARLLDAKAQGYLTPSDKRRDRRPERHKGVVGDASRLRNELEVVVVGCRGLPARGGGGSDVAPSVYVHYQMLGFQDVFTPVVHGSRDPSFHHSMAFPLATDDKLLRFLASSPPPDRPSSYAYLRPALKLQSNRLTVTVMDDIDDNGDVSVSDADESEGLIGETLIDLSPLANGRPVLAEWVTVKDAMGGGAGRISVSARWVKPLRTGGDPGPHGLSAEEVEELMARFSPEKDGQVNYVAFLRECDPPPAVLAALGQVHAFLSEEAKNDGLCATEALGAVLGIPGSDPKARVSEETFVSALLSSGKLSASPEELVAVYVHAAGRGGTDGTSNSNKSIDRGITLEHIAAFTVALGGPGAPDGSGGPSNCWVNWVGAVARSGDGGAPARRALVKARAKCRHACLLGRSFPGEAFSRLDPEGAGKVSRPAFKRALREMGFALVDEAPERGSDGSAGGDDRPGAMMFVEQWDLPEQQKGQKGQKEEGGAEGSRNLGSVVKEEEEEEDRAGRGFEEICSREGAGEERDAKMKAFRERVEKIERCTAEKVQEIVAPLSGRKGNGSNQPPGQPGGRQEKAAVEPRMAKLEANCGDHFDDVDSVGVPLHPSSVVSHSTRGKARDRRTATSEFLGREEEDAAAATLLQSRFRGYHARKFGAVPGGGIASSRAKDDGNPRRRGREDEGRCSILDLEDCIDAALGKLEGSCAQPDIHAAFAKLDRASTGFLDRPRFALALRGIRPALELPPSLLRAAMDYFDTRENDPRDGGEESGKIDYRAFTIFCEERRPPDVSPAVNLLRSTALHPGAIDIFSRKDSLGRGSICRVDLFEGLRELGVAGTPPLQLRHLATLFEETEDEVDYASLVAFASEQPAALRVASAVSRLRGHLAVRSCGEARVDLRSILEVFAVGDAKGGDRWGILRQAELDAALKELGLEFTQDEKAALYRRLDPTGAGISCCDLVAFIEDQSSSNLPGDSPSMTVDEEIGRGKLLRRAQATIVEAAQRMDTDFEGLFDRPYLRYDWRRTGRVGTAEFIRSTIRCGFPFTRAQAAFLAGVFGDGQEVTYPKFLSWASPGPDGLAGSGTRRAGTAIFPRDPTPRLGTNASIGANDRDDIVEDSNAAELKIRTALHRMGEGNRDGISRAWREFERMDPAGRRGGVYEHELVEILSNLGLPVTARDVESLMRRFSTRASQSRGGEEACFLYPRLLRSVAGQEDRCPTPGRPRDILRKVRTELRKLVRRNERIVHGGGGGVCGVCGDPRPAALRAFEVLDRDGSGRVSRRDFRRALEDLGFDLLGDAEAEEILDHFDPHGVGRIRYEDFLRAIDEGDQSGFGDRRRYSGDDSGGGISERGRLRATLSRAIDHGIDYRREMELEEGSEGGRVEEGVVSRQSFRSTMKLLRADLSKMELRSLEGRFAVPLPRNTFVSGASRARGTAEGGIRYVELLHWGAPVQRAAKDDEIWAEEERLRSMVRRRFNVWLPGALKKAFRHFDARRKGKVSETDLSEGLRRLGFELSAGQERALFKKMDLDGKSSIAYPDLVVFARDPNHSDVRNKILRQLTPQVTEAQLRVELERRDPSASGVISEQALGKALVRLGAEPRGADLGRLMHRFDRHEDGTADIERVLSCFSSDAVVDGTKEQGCPRLRHQRHHRGRGIAKWGDGSDEDDVLEDARDKIRAVLEGSAAGRRLSPRGLFDYLNSEGIGEVEEVDLRKGLEALGVKLTKREVRRLVEATGEDGAKGPPSSSRRISFRQFSRLMDGRRTQNASSGTKTRDKPNALSDFVTSSSRRGKGVTFRDDDDGREGDSPSAAPFPSKAELRVSLHRLASVESEGPSTGELIGIGVRERLRGALQDAAEARGARRRERCVDRETIRRAMVGCGAPLSVKVLSDLERRFDRSGTGDIDVEDFVDFVAKEVEMDAWERLAVNITSAERTRRGWSGSGHEGGTVRAFIADLRRAADGRNDASRRELRKSFERQGVCAPSEGDFLVLCDSIDPDRRGRVRISDVRGKLERGVTVGSEVGSAREGDSDSGSSSEAAAAAATALEKLRGLVHAAERERGIDLLESFEHFDRRRQGEVSEVEFWEGLQSLGLGHDLPLWHAPRIVESFKGRKPGNIRYRDFVAAMGRSHSSDRTSRKSAGGQRHRSADLIERLVDRLKEEVGRLTDEKGGPPPFRRVFEAADRRGKGALPPAAFRRCLLEGLGFELSEDECETLLEYLDTGGDNNISYREFLQFLGHEARERTPTRSRSPRRTRSAATGRDGATSYGGNRRSFAAADSEGNGDDQDAYITSPPRRR